MLGSCLIRKYIDICTGMCGKIHADYLLVAVNDPADIRARWDVFEYLAVVVRGGRAAFLRLGLHVFHFSFLLRLRFAVDVVKWIHRRFL